MVTNKLLSLLAVSVSLGTLPMAAVAEDDAYKIPLKLFGPEDIIGGESACKLAFWQQNRDPLTDRYAYLFHANQESDGFTGAAQLTIGDKVHSVTELVSGGEPISGHATQFLFASDDRDVKVQIELLEAEFRDGAFYFDRAKLTVIQKGKLPFTANAKGMSGCPGLEDQQQTAASVAEGLPAGIPIGQERLLGALSDIPPVLSQQMRDYAADACDIGGQFAWSGARYQINEDYLLWQIPCFQGAYQASGVFGVTQNPPQDWGELLTLPNPPGLEGNQNFAAMNAAVIGRSGHIETTELSRGAGDCGIYQLFRLIDGPGEVLELELLEYREKIECDGVATAPQSWPLAYSAR